MKTLLSPQSAGAGISDFKTAHSTTTNAVGRALFIRRDSASSPVKSHGKSQERVAATT
jgi:hypothetical protein